jgi:NAD(P)-dependent dehydrogenase (short-subunit alcohol dehydrogenase family)
MGMATGTTRELAGRVALVTGAAAGIGRASALALAAAGASVVASDIDIAGGEETAALAGANAGDAIFVRADVASEADVVALVRAAVDRYGRLDCAVNNAGIAGLLALAGDYSLADWRRVIDINLTGVFLCLREEVSQMLRQGGGSIVNMASVYGLRSTPTAPAYTATKHAVVGLTRSAAGAYSAQGVRVNAICPGFIRTAMIEPLFKENPAMEADLVARHPIGRLGTPEEVAAAVVWLCSDAASFVTGHTLAVDGGFLV